MTLPEAAWKHRPDLEALETRQWIQRCDHHDQANVRRMNSPRVRINYTAIVLAAWLLGWAVAAWIELH